jgi:hypothetical protein
MAAAKDSSACASSDLVSWLTDSEELSAADRALIRPALEAHGIYQLSDVQLLSAQDVSELKLPASQLFLMRTCCMRLLVSHSVCCVVRCRSQSTFVESRAAAEQRTTIQHTKRRLSSSCRARPSPLSAA